MCVIAATLMTAERLVLCMVNKNGEEAACSSRLVLMIQCKQFQSTLVLSSIHHLEPAETTSTCAYIPYLKFPLVRDFESRNTLLFINRILAKSYKVRRSSFSTRKHSTMCVKQPCCALGGCCRTQRTFPNCYTMGMSFLELSIS